MKKVLIILMMGATILGCGSYGPGPGYEFSDAGLKAGPSPQSQLSSASQPITDERLIVSTADYKIKSLNPDSIHARVIDLAYSLGGYVLLAEEGKTSIRIPAVGFKSAVDEIEKIGEIIDKHVAGKDVTEEFKDLEIRLDNAEQTRKRYLQLLEKANTIDDILKLERELERFNNEIELLKGKIERLSHLVQYATVTVQTAKEVRPGPIGYVFYGLYEGIKWLFIWDK